jgi:Glycosyl transferase family 64 domain
MISFQNRWHKVGITIVCLSLAISSLYSTSTKLQDFLLILEVVDPVGTTTVVPPDPNSTQEQILTEFGMQVSNSSHAPNRTEALGSRNRAIEPQQSNSTGETKRTENFSQRTNASHGEDLIRKPKSNRTLPIMTRSEKSEVPVNVTTAPKDTMTVLISTYKQNACLDRLIQHLRTCRSVVSVIHVNWFENDNPPREKYNNASETPVLFDVLPNKISHRFAPRFFSTDAIFSMDVDMGYSCPALQFAFDTWKELPNPPNSAVGFHPRNIKKFGMYKADGSYPPPYRRNTVFITKGGITHKDIFRDYFDSDLANLREQIDNATSAEDLLMSYLLARKKATVMSLCHAPGQGCTKVCHEGVLSLAIRTAHQRAQVLENIKEQFHHILGHRSPTEDTLRWQVPPTNTSWCSGESYACSAHYFDKSLGW